MYKDMNLRSRGVKRWRFIRDPIWGDIIIDDYIWHIIDSPYFQRLRDVKQLSFVDYVWPGAKHTRFEHSIGVYALSRRFLENLYVEEIIKTQSGEELRKKRLRYAINDIFQETGIYKPSHLIENLIYLYALLHDIGHYPLSHVLEREIIRSVKEVIRRFKKKRSRVAMVLFDILFGEKNSLETLKSSKKDPHEFILLTQILGSSLVDSINEYFRKCCESNSSGNVGNLGRALFVMMISDNKELLSDTSFLNNLIVKIDDLKNVINSEDDEFIKFLAKKISITKEDIRKNLLNWCDKFKATFIAIKELTEKMREREKLLQLLNMLNALKQIIDSKYDLDKIDYINRDRYYTGVKSAFFDTDRLLKFGVFKRRKNCLELDFEYKARSEREALLYARNYLYSIVYYHHKVQFLSNLLKQVYDIMALSRYDGMVKFIVVATLFSFGLFDDKIFIKYIRTTLIDSTLKKLIEEASPRRNQKNRTRITRLHFLKELYADVFLGHKKRYLSLIKREYDFRAYFIRYLKETYPFLNKYNDDIIFIKLHKNRSYQCFRRNLAEKLSEQDMSTLRTMSNRIKKELEGHIGRNVEIIIGTIHKYDETFFNAPFYVYLIFSDKEIRDKNYGYRREFGRIATKIILDEIIRRDRKNELKKLLNEIAISLRKELKRP